MVRIAEIDSPLSILLPPTPLPAPVPVPVPVPVRAWLSVLTGP
jgi:hypothetical protein